MLFRWSSTALVGLSALWYPPVNAQLTRSFRLEGKIQTSTLWTPSISRWNGEGLVGYGGDVAGAPLILTIDRVGRREEFLLLVPDASLHSVRDVAIAAGGEIAVVANGSTKEGKHAAFVVRIAPDRKHQTVTQTWPYSPEAVTFAPDGSVWTVGRLSDEENTRTIADRALRNFDAKGTPLGSGNIDTGGGEGPMNLFFLLSSRDRLGWFGAGGEYIEFSLDGKEIGRYEGPAVAHYRSITGVALSEDNDVVAGIFGDGEAEFVALDRPSRTWIPVNLPEDDTPTWTWVLGFDGDTLVTTGGSEALLRFTTR